jgi:Protein of unknown function (DUF1203)
MAPEENRELLMDFKITGLPAATFRSLFTLSEAELAARSAARMVADRRPGFPCRVSLRDADPGETVLLLNFEHLSVASPYRSRHAIFVRENAAEACLEVNEVPEVLRTRLLSLRAFDSAGIMIDADVMQGRDLTPAINLMLNLPEVQYLHVHNAKPGCFAARIDRVET